MNINILLIKYLKDGLSQTEVSEELKKMDFKPNSVSSVEKKLKSLREEYGAKTLFHLACILHELDELGIKAAPSQK